MAGYFITGTGTDVGKTLLTAALCWQLGLKKRKARAIKPVMTGVDGQNWKQSDAAELMAAMGKPLDAMALKHVSPWRFADPISPHLAAQKAGAELDFEEIATFCESTLQPDETTLVEAIGGVMTPLTGRHTVLDLAQVLELPVVLVTGSYVGAISHTLSAISVLLERGLEIQSVVISESEGSATSLNEMASSIQQFAGANLELVTLPRIAPANQLWKDLPPLLKVIGQ